MHAVPERTAATTYLLPRAELNQRQTGQHLFPFIAIPRNYYTAKHPVHPLAVKHSYFHQPAPMPHNSLPTRNLVDGNSTVTQNTIWLQSTQSC